MTKLRKTFIDRWSIMENVIKHLENLELDDKKEILMQQIHAMSSKSVVADTVYSLAMIVRAFMYFATSRALYRRTCKDFQLPSVSTLKRFTSAVSKIDEEEFVSRVLHNLTTSRS